jgi:hypothetical protein
VLTLAAASIAAWQSAVLIAVLSQKHSGSRLQLRLDAGHNIFGIPWWVWVLGGVALVAFAVFAGPEMIVFAPEVMSAAAEAAAEEAAMGAGDAAFNASMAAQGFEGVTAESLGGGTAIQGEAMSEAVGNALQEGIQAAQETYGQVYGQVAAEQAEAYAAQAQAASELNTARVIAAGVGPVAVAVGASEIPSVLDGASGTAQPGASSTPGSSGSGGTTPNTGGNAGGG